MRRLLPVGVIATVVLLGAGSAYADGASVTVNSSVDGMGASASASADQTNGLVVSAQGASANPAPANPITMPIAPF